MAERLKYGFQKTRQGSSRLAVEVPDVVWQRAEKNEDFVGVVRYLGRKSVKAIAIEHEEGYRRVFINDKRFKSAKEKRPYMIEGTSRLIRSFELAAGNDFYDPRLRMDLAKTPDSESRTYKSLLAIRLPEAIPDSMCADLATTRMRDMARHMCVDATDSIRAVIDKEQASVALELEGPNHKIYTDRFTSVDLFDSVLRTENVTSIEQQLIGVVGAVAIAHADELV
jgi:hypothetical protein